MYNCCLVATTDFTGSQEHDGLWHSPSVPFSHTWRIVLISLLSVLFFFSLAESVSQPILSFPSPCPWLFSYGNELFSSTGRLREA
jgi:hypothetical protein